MHSSLFFNRLVVVNNTIILLKYFHKNQYYNSTKSVVPLSDIHADAAFCPLQNAKAPFLPHCKLQQFPTHPVFHQRASVNFSPVFSLFAVFILDTPISTSSTLPSRSLCLTTWLVHSGVPLSCNHSCAVNFQMSDVWRWAGSRLRDVARRARAGRAGLQMLPEVQLCVLPPAAVLGGSWGTTRCFLHFEGFGHRLACLCPLPELQQQQL